MESNFPPWIKRLDRGFQKLFWNVKPSFKDLEKENTVPAMPSQLCIMRDLELIIQIMANDHKKAGLSMEECLPVNEDKKRKLRSDDLSRFERSMKRGGHDNKMSVFKRQQHMLKEMMENENMEGIIFVGRKERKRMIENYVLNMIETEQNKIRKHVEQGSLKNPIKTYQN